MNRSPRNKYFTLLIGIAFLGYGSYRLISFYLGADYNTFRIIVDIILVLLGAWDIYRFIKISRKK
ncbi:hypothetical protein SAMN04488034_102121 [Salinimicrobium catena]|uniref:Uncharacterized protein n=1 Tax=Salinimicrobium catena TaxID=390640 RepID=A0A1H5L420_9FLAO|nr:hypothetical protein [Salinimicrobium catena]SDL05367.1 hypothetical protein SAMN04488140_102121 [Salinimicrobium catena]SEE71700.1 hypothetical protein SAMN04488034_102121 [Salinimicrobium catena]